MPLMCVCRFETILTHIPLLVEERLAYGKLLTILHIFISPAWFNGSGYLSMPTSVLFMDIRQPGSLSGLEYEVIGCTAARTQQHTI